MLVSGVDAIDLYFVFGLDGGVGCYCGGVDAIVYFLTYSGVGERRAAYL